MDFNEAAAVRPNPNEPALAEARSPWQLLRIQKVRAAIANYVLLAFVRR
jgi:hypothetical protein